MQRYFKILCAAAIPAAILSTTSASVARADTGLGRHKTLYAVPAPGKVVIDGKLDDWDLSGQIYMYVTSETADMQSARFAVMYDAQALYLSGVVRDPSPLMNRHDPAVDGLMAEAKALEGDIDGAKAILAVLEQRARTTYIDPNGIAFATVGLGRLDDTLVYLRKARNERTIGAVFLKVDPRWDALRGNPEFRRISDITPTSAE